MFNETKFISITGLEPWEFQSYLSDICTVVMSDRYFRQYLPYIMLHVSNSFVEISAIWYQVSQEYAFSSLLNTSVWNYKMKYINLLNQNITKSEMFKIKS